MKSGTSYIPTSKTIEIPGDLEFHTITKLTK